MGLSLVWRHKLLCMHAYNDLLRCKSVCDVKPGIDPWPLIDLFSFVCLLSQCRPRDGALENYFFQVQTYPRENEWIIFRYIKEKFPWEHHMIHNGQFTYVAKEVYSSVVQQMTARFKKAQCVSNRYKDLFKWKKYFGVRCTLTGRPHIGVFLWENVWAFHRDKKLASVRNSEVTVRRISTPSYLMCETIANGVQHVFMMGKN